MAEIVGPVVNGVCVLERNPKVRLPCVVAHCLVEPKGNKVPIRLLTPRPD